MMVEPWKMELMATTQLPLQGLREAQRDAQRETPPREPAALRRATERNIDRLPLSPVDRGGTAEPAPFDPGLWQRILSHVRVHHPTLNREWFNQLHPRQLTNGVIQVTVQKIAQLNFCQGQC